MICFEEVVNNITPEMSEEINIIKSQIDLKNVSWAYHLSEEFINIFQDSLDWEGISTCTNNLSEEFLQKNIDKLHTDYLLISRKLSEGFIEENLTRLFSRSFKFSDIVFYQPQLSNDFIDRINMLLELEK